VFAGRADSGKRKRELFVDLLRRMLALDSGAGITATLWPAEALKYPFVTEPL
jgi:hypothetical protein